MIFRDSAGASLWQRLGLLAILLLFLPAFVLADKSPPSPEGIRWADSNNGDVDFFWLDIGGTQLSAAHDDDVVYPVSLPFSFTYYNEVFNTLYVSSNGYVTFRDYGSNSFPTPNDLSPNLLPDAQLAIFWHNLNLSNVNHPNAAPRIYTKTVGTAPYRKFVIGYNEAIIGVADPPLNFEIILYESTNIIKYQYLNVGVSLSGTGIGVVSGVRYQIGTSLSNDSLTYSGLGDQNLSNNLAVLYYPADTTGTGITSDPGQLDVTDVVANTSNQNFTLTVNNINFTSLPSMQDMGKFDIIKINNPMGFFPGSDAVTVSRVTIDGNNYFLGANDANPPSEELGTTLGAVATWSYDAPNDTLIIQVPSFAVKSSVEVEFQVNIPSAQGNSFTFNPVISSRTEPLNRVTASASFNVVAGTDTLIRVQDPAATGTVIRF